MCMATIVSFGWARTLIAHERASLLSSESNERPMSILEGAEGIIVNCKLADRLLVQLSSCKEFQLLDFIILVNHI